MFSLRNWSKSPIGLTGLALSVLSAIAYTRFVMEVAYSRPEGASSDAGVFVSMIGSGVSILLCLLSIGLEEVVFPGIIGLGLLVIVENWLLLTMIISTFTLALRWPYVAIGYALAMLVAFYLTLLRIAKSFNPVGRPSS